MCFDAAEDAGSAVKIYQGGQAAGLIQERGVDAHRKSAYGAGNFAIVDRPHWDVLGVDELREFFDGLTHACGDSRDISFFPAANMSRSLLIWGSSAMLTFLRRISTALPGRHKPCHD